MIVSESDCEASAIYGDIYCEDVLVVGKNDTAVRASLDAVITGHVLQEPVSSTQNVIAIAPDINYVIVGSYSNASVTAFDFSSGNKIWTKRGFKELLSITYGGRAQVFVAQYQHNRCTSLDARTGEIGETLLNVLSFHSDQVHSKLLIEFKDKISKTSWLECRNEILQEPIFRIPLQASGVQYPVMLNSGIIYTNVSLGELVYVSYQGEQLWRWHASDNSHFWCLTAISNNRLFTIRRSKSDSHLNHIMIFDIKTGRCLLAKPLPREHLAHVPVAHGRFVAERDGILNTETLQWNPKQFRVPNDLCRM